MKKMRAHYVIDIEGPNDSTRRAMAGAFLVHMGRAVESANIAAARLGFRQSRRVEITHWELEKLEDLPR